MTTSAEQQAKHHGDDKVKVAIHVNEQPVRLEKRNLTGAEVKATAMAQGVAIQANFVLMKDLGGGRTEIVSDHDKVKVDSDSRFIAIHPDDNS